MPLSVQTVVREGGKLLSHLQEAFSFLFIPYSTVQTPRLIKDLGRGRRRGHVAKGLLLAGGAAGLCPCPWCQRGSAAPSLRFSERLPGFDQYFHLAAEKKFPVENVVEAALFSKCFHYNESAF